MSPWEPLSVKSTVKDVLDDLKGKLGAASYGEVIEALIEYYRPAGEAEFKQWFANRKNREVEKRG